MYKIKFKWLVVVYAAFVVSALGGCAGEGSVVSGQGSNHDDDNATTAAGTTAPLPIQPIVGHLPAHCPEVMRPVEPLIGCSVKSFEECSCYSLVDPAQSK